MRELIPGMLKIFTNTGSEFKNTENTTMTGSVLPARREQPEACDAGAGWEEPAHCPGGRGH